MILFLIDSNTFKSIYMRNSISILLLISISLFQSCGEKDAGNESEMSEIVSLKEITVSNDFLSDPTNLLVIDPIETIDLEMEGNPNISYINDIAFTKENIFLVDRMLGVLKFDRNGKFISQIGKKGEAPEEYQMAVAINLNENKNNLIVADWSQMKIVSYDLEGNFLASTKLPGNPISFFTQQDSVLVFQEDMNRSTKKNEQNIIFSSVNFETLDSKNYQNSIFTWDSKFHRNYSFLNVLGNSNDQDLFYLPRVFLEGLSNHNDTIFRKENDQLNPEFLIQFSGFNKDEKMGIDHMDLYENQADLLFKQNKQSYFLKLDLQNKKPLAFLSVFNNQELSVENFPKHLGDELYYSVFKDESGTEEKNPSIIIYQMKDVEKGGRSL